MKVTADFFSQSTSNVTSISQKAALAALQFGTPELKVSIDKLAIKRNRMLKKFETLKLMKVIPPQGAFYFWVQVTGCFEKTIQGQKLSNSKDVANLLLERFFVATVPGIEFGMEGYIRLSIAASDDHLDRAFERMLAFESALT